MVAVSKDGKKIEEDAVIAVRRCFRDVNRISAEIAENDKTPCVDGRLLLYSSEEMKIETLSGDIDVQVKGTTNEISSCLRYSVKTRDLKYFERHGGAMYFVVVEHIDSDDVYYRLLLPLDIRNILRGHSSQKTVSLLFQPFPSGGDEVLRLVTQAIRDKYLQQPGTSLALCSLDEYKAKGYSFKEHTFSVDLMPGETLASLAPYGNGVYVYGTDPYGSKHPIGKIANIKSVAIGRDACVSAGEVSFTTKFSIGENEADGIFICFDGFRFNCAKNIMQFTEKGPLSVRLRDLRLLRELRATGNLLLDGERIASFSFHDKSGIEELEQHIQAYERIDAVAKRLHFKIDLDVESLTEQNRCDLDCMYQGLIKGNVLHRPNMDSGIYSIKLPGFVIKLLLLGKGNDEYVLMDALDVDTSLVTPVCPGAVDGLAEPVPPLLIQRKDDFVALGNIDPDLFKETCTRIPVNSHSALFANAKLFEMLMAVDEGALCISELLDCCLLLADFLSPFLQPEVSTINRLQIKARKSGLNKEDHLVLAELIASSDNLLTKACASILRGDAVQTRVLLNKMTEAERESIISSPISHFMDDETKRGSALGKVADFDAGSGA